MEIFKKYTYLEFPTIYDCIAELDNGSVIIVYNEKTRCHIVPIANQKYYKEYKEPPKPIVHERWLHWLREPTGSICTVLTGKEKCCHSPTYKCLKVDNITFEEIPDTCNGNCTCAGGQPCCKKGCKA